MYLWHTFIVLILWTTACSSSHKAEGSFLVRLKYRTVLGGDYSKNHEIFIKKDIKSSKAFLLDGPDSQYTLFSLGISDQEADSLFEKVSTLTQDFTLNSTILNREDYHNDHSSVCELEILTSSYPYGNLMSLDGKMNYYNLFHESHSRKLFITYSCNPFKDEAVNELMDFHRSVIKLLKAKNLKRIAPVFKKQVNKSYANSFFSYTGNFELLKPKIPFKSTVPDIFSQVNNDRYIYDRFNKRFIATSGENEQVEEKKAISIVLAKFNFSEYGSLCISENGVYLLFTIKESNNKEKLYLYNLKNEMLTEISMNSFQISEENMAIDNSGNVYLNINNELYKWSPHNF